MILFWKRYYSDVLTKMFQEKRLLIIFDCELYFARFHGYFFRTFPNIYWHYICPNLLDRYETKVQHRKVCSIRL